MWMPFVASPSAEVRYRQDFLSPYLDSIKFADINKFTVAFVDAESGAGIVAWINSCNIAAGQQITRATNVHVYAARSTAGGFRQRE